MKTHNGIFYFPSRFDANEYAIEHGRGAVYRLVEYRRGWAIQLRRGGPYVGPGKGTDR